MTEKNNRKIYIELFFFVFLSAGFFCLSPNKILAALEVQYPAISGSSLNTNSTLPDFAIYLFKAGMFLGFFSVFLSLVIAGATWILSPLSPEARSISRDRAWGAISGLLLLILTYLIITTINPQLAIFKTSNLPSIQQSPAVSAPSGVYFYTKDGCPDEENVQAVTSSGPLARQISSVKVAQDSNTGTSYLSILYQNLNFSGKCLFINGNQDCQSAISPQTKKPFALSASVYKYNPNPNGDGVYFYRKSNFDSSGGSLYISNSTIKNSGSKNLYETDLNQLRFNGVPEDEQDCIKYDANGKCAKDGRTPPTLAGENISSIKIKGDYLVLLTYYNPKTDTSNFWTYCQEFPAAGDISQSGPQQIKWENIRNNGGVVANYVMIIPI